MAATEVYEAYDEDYLDDNEYNEGGEEESTFILNGEDYDEEAADEDDYGPGVTVSWSSKPVRKEKPVSDVAEEAYLDPLGLVNCWEEALLELKAAHVDRFLPPAEAPRSLAQRQAKAPLWYGPSTVPNPLPIASTSQLLSAQPSSSASSEQAQAFSITPVSRESVEPATKKRKRLTGSQKKARKAAKLANNPATSSNTTVYQSGRVLNPSHDTKGKSRAEEEEEDDRSQSPGYEPQSPNLESHLLPVQPQPVASAEGRQVPPHLVATQPSPIQPRSDNSASPRSTNGLPPPPAPFVVLSKLPISFPPPPPITPLTGQEPALEPETSESLLESALWSWYTAGYQTALYHASVGVATFKPSETDGTEGETGANQ
ncbi:uncharacterized protein JCM6883_006748 [Sporobolomyces salmoneus]|uniref:uncharacterized protein n=1 Tax=Sporobolomyces salmoneus TaxID=183962 RepID=UPI0031702177